jgi:hypothetical protein
VLTLVGAAGTTVSAAAASGWPRATSALLPFDDRMMNGKWRHHQHNDEHVQQERQRRARSPVLTPTRQSQRR